MKNIIINLTFILFSINLYSQAIVIDVNELYKTIEANPYRAVEQMADWENKLVQLNGTLGWFAGSTGSFEMFFSNNGKTCLDNALFTTTPIKSFGVKTKVNDVSFIYNLNKGENISITGYMKNIDEVKGASGCVYFLIDLIQINNIQIKEDQTSNNIEDNNSSIRYESYLYGDQIVKMGERYIGKIIKYTGFAKGADNFAASEDHIDFVIKRSSSSGFSRTEIRVHFDNFLSLDEINKINSSNEVTIIGTLIYGKQAIFDVNPDWYIEHSILSTVNENDKRNINSGNDNQEGIKKENQSNNMYKGASLIFCKDNGNGECTVQIEFTMNEINKMIVFIDFRNSIKLIKFFRLKIFKIRDDDSKELIYTDNYEPTYKYAEIPNKDFLKLLKSGTSSQQYVFELYDKDNNYITHKFIIISK